VNKYFQIVLRESAMGIDSLTTRVTRRGYRAQQCAVFQMTVVYAVA
jgi:hypothetical protein